MINKINIRQDNKNKISFKGPLNVLTKGLELCNKYPMVGVSVIDLGTAIGPRTAVDFVTTNAFAAAETGRKESMGLFMNCLIPSFVVLGLAKAVQPLTMGKEFKHIDMASVWANEDTINKLSGIYKNTQGSMEQRVGEFTKTIINNLEGFVGNSKNQWSSFEGKTGNTIQELTNLILSSNVPKKETKKTLGKIFDELAANTKTTEVIRFAGDKKAFSSNLSELLRDTVALGRRFKDNAVSNNIGEFAKRSIKLVNRKSFLGMLILIPAAMSVQFINRAITKWRSGQDGAPIYKDFGKESSVNIPKDRKNLKTNMIIASAAMLGATMLVTKGQFSKKLFQFKGLFPTVAQCCWIATGTILSRIWASDDNSELKETGIKDISTFVSLYGLGDVVAKTTGSLIEKAKPDIKLISRSNIAPKNIFEAAKNWISTSKLKAFSEVSTSAKPYRSLCQLAHLGSSMIVLGLAIPRYVRYCTEKKEAKMKKLVQEQKEFNEKLRVLQSSSKAFAAFKAYNK